MKPDDLLTDLTPCPSDVTALLNAAAMERHRRRATVQAVFAAAAVIALGITAIRLSPGSASADSGPVVKVSAPARPSPMLTGHELLDTFGDQPVALVTWPDGRQKLLAINRPAARRSSTR